MNAHPPTQPALGLQTTNALCEGIRQAHQQAKSMHPQLPPTTLAEARMEAVLAAQELRNIHVLVRDHYLLRIQTEVAGKAVKQLLTMIEARRDGTMQ